MDAQGIAMIITAIGGSVITPIVIAYFGRKTVAVSTEAVEVNKAVYHEVKTANAKSAGGVTDAIWDEQIRLKIATGERLSADEQEHAASMQHNKVLEGKS